MGIDKINKPPHYHPGALASIASIEQQLGDKFDAYLEGNVLKYLHRYKYKGKPNDDLKKANWYLTRLILLKEVKRGQRR